MQTLALWQRLLLGMLGFVLAIGLSLFIGFSMLNATVFNRNFVKTIVTHEAVYESFGAGVAAGLNEQAKQELPPLSADEVQKVFDSSVGYKRFSGSFGGFVDGLFDWLEGKNERIEFEISLFENESDLKNLIVSIAELKLEDLPVCANNAQAKKASEDIFNATCKSREFSTSELSKILEEGEDENGFSELYKQAQITDESTDINQSFDQSIQDAYEFSRRVPQIGLAIAGIILVLMFAVIRELRGFLHVAGRSLMRSSATILLVGLILFGLFKVLTRTVEGLSGNSEVSLPEASLLELAGFVEGTLTRLSVVYAGSVFVVGLFAYLAAKRMHSGFEHKTDHHAVHKQTSVSSFNDR